MIRSVFNPPHLSSRAAFLSATCVFVAFTSHTIHAATLNVNQLLTKAAQGSVMHEIQLAEAYLTGKGVAQNAELATHWYERAAQGGNPEAQNLVGQFYQAGIGVPANPSRAFHWYQLAAASGSSDALLNMGTAYELGLGVKKDESLAIQFFHQAVDKGNGTGAAYIGILTYIGAGVNKDVVAAEHWFNVGQKLHDPISAYNLGILYSTVPDHPHDIEKAVKFLRQAAETGYFPATHALALLLVRYPTFAKSSDEPVSLAESAANAGYWKSSVLLGILARDGINMPVDRRAAFYHFKVAVLQGESQTETLLAGDLVQLSAKLGPEEVSAIDSEANSWFQEHHSIPKFVHTNGKKLLYIPSTPDISDAMRAGPPTTHPDA
jgi:TPR repeat protein